MAESDGGCARHTSNGAPKEENNGREPASDLAVIEECLLPTTASDKDEAASQQSRATAVESEQIGTQMKDGDFEGTVENTNMEQASQESAADQTNYPPMHFDWNVSPLQVTGAWYEFEQAPLNFLKGCKWSPDGTCLLTNSDDNVLRLFNLPAELYCGAGVEGLTEMVSVLKMQEGETVYDFCWYPFMSSLDPDTCCFLSTCRDHPIHMWDAFTGQLRCSYRAYNQMDEVAAASSIAFNLDGSRIYCGFNKMIRVFDTARPGRECQERPTVVKKHGQSGIISCIAISPDNSGVYALGSYSKSVGVYCEPKGDLMCLVEGQVGGVTHILFSPDGNRLYSGGRKDNEILCWDMRNPGRVLYRLLRSVTTNQRIYFDMDKSGRYIFSGSADGTVLVWDTTVPPVCDDSSEPTIQPVYSYVAHGDCVNGVSLHPTLPFLASTSGQRKFPMPMAGDDEQAVDSDTEPEDDNSLRLWALSCVNEE